MAVYTNYGPPRWIFVNADGTKRSGSSDLTSVKNATGDYTVTLTDGSTALAADGDQVVMGDPFAATLLLVLAGSLGTTVRVRVATTAGVATDGSFKLQVQT